MDINHAAVFEMMGHWQRRRNSTHCIKIDLQKQINEWSTFFVTLNKYVSCFKEIKEEQSAKSELLEDFLSVELEALSENELYSPAKWLENRAIYCGAYFLGDSCVVMQKLIHARSNERKKIFSIARRFGTFFNVIAQENLVNDEELKLLRGLIWNSLNAFGCLVRYKQDLKWDLFLSLFEKILTILEAKNDATRFFGGSKFEELCNTLFSVSEFSFFDGYYEGLGEQSTESLVAAFSWANQIDWMSDFIKENKDDIAVKVRVLKKMGYLQAIRTKKGLGALDWKSFLQKLYSADRENHNLFLTKNLNCGSAVQQFINCGFEADLNS